MDDLPHTSSIMWVISDLSDSVSCQIEVLQLFDNSHIHNTSAWVQQAQLYYEAPENRDYLTIKKKSQKYQVFENGTKMLLPEKAGLSHKKNIPWGLYK